MIQTAILLLGGLAIWMTHSPGEQARRYAPIVGLVSQPFWLVETFNAAQWGMFALSVWYTAAWLRGINREWRA